MKHKLASALVLSVAVLMVAQWAHARNPIRNAFFNVYSSANGTQLDDLPSNAGHCGVCHYDFDGGGARNPYGLAVEVARNSGNYADDEAAIQSLESLDSDGDGFLNITEITSLLYSNTPTFPGLTENDSALVVNIPWSEVAPYVEPTGATDITPPTVTLLSPNGGGAYDPHTTQAVTWDANDANGIDRIELYMSDDNGSTWEHIAKGEPDDGTFDWFVPNLPGGQTLLRVEAYDNAGNEGYDDSDATFTINTYTGGVAPTTLRDMKLPGTQPFVVSPLEDPDVNCKTCHGNYDSNVEPWFNWKGSMMGQAMRDPIFLACMEVAEHDAPSVGDLCLRCHTPGGWLEGRSTDTSGGMITAKDRQGIHCDFCHRLVDYNSLAAEDQDIINGLDELPAQYGNGQFVVDPLSTKRGPYNDAVASHSTIYSEFHLSANLCGTCHDVSNPVFVRDSTVVYSPNGFDAEHPDGDLRNMFPIERTFSEWSASAYAAGGVYQPQFAGDKPDGIVSTCQDCHMRDITGVGCSEPGAPTRTDLPHHDLTGGNHFIPDILPLVYPGEVDTTRLQAGKQRAIDMLQLAASMALAKGQDGGNPTVTVTVTNETGHKLPSGYPEGRRIWLNIKGYDAQGGNLVYESGAYDPGTAVLTHDEDVKIYEIQPGISNRISPVVGLPVGKSFHFVLNDTVFSDNRIPPRGFTNAAFEAVQSPPVAHVYADSQYWDETSYTLPPSTRFVEATLYYQGVSKEYAEFLRDANPNPVPNAGTVFYDAYAATGMAAPVVMQHDTITVDLQPTGITGGPLAITALDQNYPNPFNPMTTVRYSLESRQHVSIKVYNVRGELVRTLVDEERPAGYQKIRWYGQNQNDERVASGVYFIKMTTARNHLVRKAVLLK